MRKKNYAILQLGSIVIIADTRNDRLALWTLRDGKVLRHVGSFGERPGQFMYLGAVAITSSKLLVVTDEKHVQILTVTGDVVRVLALDSIQSRGVAVSPVTNDIIITDEAEYRVIVCSWGTEVRMDVLLYL